MNADEGHHYIDTELPIEMYEPNQPYERFDRWFWPALLALGCVGIGAALALVYLAHKFN